MTGSRPVAGQWENQGNLRFWTISDGSLNVQISAPGGVQSISLDPVKLAEVLSEMPGFTVKYVKPIEVPQYLGAVVQRDVNRWVRVARDDESSAPWIRAGSSGVGVSTTSDAVAGILANGGFEREPEFPQRTP